MKSEAYLSFSYITPDMINEAGANVEGMDYQAVLKMDGFASNMLDEGYEVKFLFNGMNTGDHKSPEHQDGKAIDFTLVSINKSLPKNPPLWTVVAKLCFYGFKAIGVYLNHEGYYSYHADIVEYRQWIQIIGKDKNRKQYPLLNFVVLK